MGDFDFFLLVYLYFLICSFIMNMYFYLFSIFLKIDYMYRILVKIKGNNEKHSTIFTSQCILHKCEVSPLTLLLYFSFFLVLDTLAPRS